MNAEAVSNSQLNASTVKAIQNIDTDAESNEAETIMNDQINIAVEQQHSVTPTMALSEKSMKNTSGKWQSRLRSLNQQYGLVIKVLVMALAFGCFIIAGLIINTDKTLVLFYIAATVSTMYLTSFAYNKCSVRFEKSVNPVKSFAVFIWDKRIVRWCFYLACFTGVATVLIIDNISKPANLISAAGLAFFIGVSWLFSNNRSKITWRPVIWGIFLQFILSLIILRWKAGRDVFDFLSRAITSFLNFTVAGTAFVYGFLVTPPNICRISLIPIFAFSVLPTIIFFSSFINILYYYGIMQCVVRKIAVIMTVSMGTTGAESLSAASNIFIGMTEAPLLIKPYLSVMTNSEIHAVMTCGFATIAGGLFNVYVSFGACANHILSASVMSAPASMAISKLLYPETHISQTKDLTFVESDNPNAEKTAFEAAASGAVTGMKLVVNIIANLIAFMALLAFLDWLVVWLASMVNHPEVDFKKLLSWLFYPIAFLMGAGENHEELLIVSELLGIKTFINEFVAYERMQHYINEGKLSSRAQLIATYSLCGFSNFTSIGIQIGGIGAMCPERRPDIAGMAMRAMVAGSMACFMTACIAGLLTRDLSDCVITVQDTQRRNCTELYPQSTSIINISSTISL